MTLAERVITAVLGFGSFFLLIYLMVAKSDGFGFAERWVRESPAIAEQVGPLRAVRLSPMPPFRASSGGDSGSFHGTLNITGEKGKLSLFVAAQKRDGTWTLTRARSDDRSYE